MIHLLTLNTFVTCWQMKNILLPESDEVDSHEYYAWGDLQRQVSVNMAFFCLQVKKTVSSFKDTHTFVVAANGRLKWKNWIVIKATCINIMELQINTCISEVILYQIVHFNLCLFIFLIKSWTLFVIGLPGFDQ